MLYKWTTVSTLSTLLANLVLENKHTAQWPACFIQRLSPDIVVDCLLPLLSVEEVICLRRVNKLFFLLTQEPIVWQRILRRLAIPTPPLSTKFRPGVKLPDHEAEELVTRAITVDDRFRDANTMLHTSFKLAIPEIALELKLLLGGKYLVASVARRRNTGRTYALAIMNVEAHESEPKTTAALSEDLESRAYCLDAKFMRYHGEDGIMISHVRRFWSPDPQAIGTEYELDEQPQINLDEQVYDAYSGEKYPQEFECECTFISIVDLERAMDPHAKAQIGARNIFRPVRQYWSALRIYDPALYSLHERPHVSFTEQPRYTLTSQPPDRVVFLPIESDTAPSVLICNKIQARATWMHRVRQLRVLPGQNQVLIVRTVYHPQFRNEHAIELYNLPPKGRTALYTSNQLVFLTRDGVMRNFHLSDFYLPPTYTVSNNQDRYPPISIYMVANRPQTVLHYLLWPTRTQGTTDNANWIYDLSGSIVPQSGREADSDINLRLLPGVHRALVWGHEFSDRRESPSTLVFQRYICRQRGPPRTDWQDKSQEPMLARGRKEIPQLNIFAYLQNVNVNTFPEFFEKGIASISWDESIGRACAVCGDSNVITVMDIAKTDGM
ncbi:hypothetical protein BDZ89DRAFT_1079670, partial [Hymenopellis radicata]